MEKKPAENIHDKFFRETFGEPKMAAEFLRHYLPPDFADALDLDHLEVLKDSFIDEEFKEHFSDLLCRVRLKTGNAVFIYILIEHKSWPERMVALQLLRYMLKIWEPMARERGVILPVIFPLVFYHGKRRWNVAHNFSALFDEQALAKVRQYVPDFQYFLCDLSVYSETPVTGDEKLQSSLLALRGVFEEATINWLARIMQLLLDDPKQWKQLGKIADYLVLAGRIGEKDMQQAIREAKTTSAKRKKFVRTFLDDWVDKGMEKGLKQGLKQGREEGLEEGREEGALQLLLTQLNHRFGLLSKRMQNQIHELSSTEVIALGEAIFDFQSRKDLSNWLKEHRA